MFGKGLASMRCGGVHIRCWVRGSSLAFSANRRSLMKKILFVFCLLSTAAAFGQYGLSIGSQNSQAQSYQFQNHPSHADYAPMSTERSVLPSTTFLSAQGERRASDFAQPDRC